MATLGRCLSLSYQLTGWYRGNSVEKLDAEASNCVVIFSIRSLCSG